MSMPKHSLLVATYGWHTVHLWRRVVDGNDETPRTAYDHARRFMPESTPVLEMTRTTARIRHLMTEPGLWAKVRESLDEVPLPVPTPTESENAG
ncbi:MAG TPA: hypothetical protein VMF31_10480 [Solirubrobacterales bacterium]|nr:hypothetical protein [Solirubrobacterales bacterium]